MIPSCGLVIYTHFSSICFLPFLPIVLLRALGRSLRLQLTLGLLVVLGRVDTVLVVVHKVEPGHRADEQGRVSALAGGDTLEMGAEPARAVQRLAGLDLVDHFPHVQLNLSGVLGGAVEPDYHDTVRAVP